ncbi:hypothetical protein DCC81_08180 [Chitinophaga parva]|uniref:HdeD family acid-resistance protein n=1 Tax=Chitinophaga parva TaxID=2169414 RepID=A0A2T7BP16_9BACT|nr:DUF308 domain-containing protein [Chitinophaga parva]PUZ29414.1 hypothetical protein DCC81_08180 [Chitinophaga parva]
MESQIKAIARSWYVELILGLLFIVVGIWVFMTPVSSYVALSFFFAAAFLVTGIMEISFAVSGRKYTVGWGWSLAAGIVDTLVGLLLVATPAFTMLVLPFYIGFAILFRSSLAIGLSIELGRLKVPDWGWLLFIGIVGIVLAFIMIWNPVFAGLTIVIYTAMAFVSMGIFELYLSFRLKKFNKEL